MSYYEVYARRAGSDEAAQLVAYGMSGLWASIDFLDQRARAGEIEGMSSFKLESDFSADLTIRGQLLTGLLDFLDVETGTPRDNCRAALGEIRPDDLYLMSLSEL
jgi:hypothetical protein